MRRTAGGQSVTGAPGGRGAHLGYAILDSQAVCRNNRRIRGPKKSGLSRQPLQIFLFVWHSMCWWGTKERLCRRLNDIAYPVGNRRVEEDDGKAVVVNKS